MEQTTIPDPVSRSPKVAKGGSAFRLGLQIVLVSFAGVLASWGTVELLAPLIGIVGVCCALRTLNFGNRVLSGIIDGLALLATFTAAARLLSPSGSYSIDLYYVVICALVATATALTWAGNSAMKSNQRVRWLTVGWVGLGAIVGLCYGYVYNYDAPFFLSLFAAAVSLVVVRKIVALPGWGIQVVNTLLLLSVALPVVDWFTRPKYHFDVDTALRNRAYSCTTAKADPVACKEWWYYYMSQWQAMNGAVCQKETGVLPYSLRPNSDGRLFQSHIHINSLGFRGKEIAVEKGGAYRIVALGESTTFGCTMRPTDRPWPEVLEELIQKRLKPGRRVEVINGAIQGLNITHSLYRLDHDILRLKPDLIIAYHGWNGFAMLYDGNSAVIGKAPPRFYERPLRLLADCEYSLKVAQYRRHHPAKLVLRPPSTEAALKSRLADAYRSLIDTAKTNHARLAIANFSMAANEQSEPDVAKFYDMTFPVAPSVRANVTQTKLIEALVAQNPGVTYVDTRPHLDGDYEKFIDLIHFTQEGRDQLAENIYAGIENVLREDFGAGTTQR